MLYFPVLSAVNRVTEMSVPEGLLMSLLGMAIVLFALVAIMFLIKIQSAVVMSLFKRKNAPVAAPVPPKAVPAPSKPKPAVGAPTAPGSLGEVALHNVPDKTAVMLMAIVADEMNVPVNELRFISVKEV